MIFCFPFWIIAISQLIDSIAALCAPLASLVPMLAMGPMMKGIMGSMIPFIEQLEEMGAAG